MAEEKKEEKKIQYTLFCSGLNNGGRKTELANKNVTDDVAILFDAVTQHSYTLSNKKTSFPVEDKSTRSDNIVAENGKFSFTAYVNSSPQALIAGNYLDRDTDPDNPKESKRPEKALEILKTIRDARIAITLVTEDIILTDYTITEINTSREAGEGAALVFTISLEEFRGVEVYRVKATNLNSMKKSKGVNKGAATNAADTTKGDLTYSERQSAYGGKSKQPFIWLTDTLGLNQPTIEVENAGVITGKGQIIPNTTNK